jgi:glycosyltransferase involved in cell wall biosynthesis
MSNRAATNVLSVIVPVYDEHRTLRDLIECVRGVDLSALGIVTEIVVVDDCSSDGTAAIAEELLREGLIDQLRVHPVNRGKGAAIRTGLEAFTGDFVIVQDADLEYDPAEYVRMLRPMLDGRADVVFGSRFIGGETRRVLYFWHSLGNRFLTLMSNMFTDLNLTDMETCYKLFRAEIARAVAVEENRFGFEPEITAKIARFAKYRDCRVYEIGISYSGRTYAEGKKVGWKDGVSALRCILKYNLRGGPKGFRGDIDLAKYRTRAADRSSVGARSASVTAYEDATNAV